MTEEKARQSELYLVGMVCYYGKHYSTFFFQTKIRRWMYFDDAHVKEVCSIISNSPYPRIGNTSFDRNTKDERSVETSVTAVTVD